MADELVINLSLDFTKDGAVSLRVPRRDDTSEYKMDVAGNGVLAKEQIIGTSPELITGAEDIGSIGYVFLQNLDDTNYVSLLGTNDGEIIRLLAGDVALFRAGNAFNSEGDPTPPYRLQADTAACSVLIAMIDA